MDDDTLDRPEAHTATQEYPPTTENRAESPEAATTLARRPSEDPAVRDTIIDFIVWNQEMENIPSDRERVAAAYDEVLYHREKIFDL